MRRFILVLTAAALLTPVLTAHEIKTPETKAVQAPQQPSADEIAQMQAQMPDFNKIIRSMQGVMQDPALQGSMKSALGAMSDKMDDEDMEAKTENGMPDLNAMMGVMLSMLGDEAVMGGLIKAIEPMQDVMPKIMEDAMPEAEAKDSTQP